MLPGWSHRGETRGKSKSDLLTKSFDRVRCSRLLTGVQHGTKFVQCSVGSVKDMAMKCAFHSPPYLELFSAYIQKWTTVFMSDCKVSSLNENSNWCSILQLFSIKFY